MSKGLLAHNGFLIRKGFKFEDDGFLIRKGLLNDFSGIPNKSDLIRRHYTRSGYNLPDLVGDNDATLLPMVSKFDGVDNLCSVTMPNDIGLSDFNISFTILTPVDVVTLKAIMNTSQLNNNFRIWIKDSKIVYDAIGSSASLSNPMLDIVANTIYNVVLSRIGTTHKLTVNQLESTSDMAANYIPATIHIASSNLGGYRLAASIWGLNFNDELYIPLPHLVYGIDSNGDPVTLTVSDSGVSASYDEEGSLHLQDYGYVEKADGSIEPNNYSGEALNTLSDDDTFVSGSLTRLNLAPSKIRFYVDGDTEDAKICMDKSNTTYWDISIQSLVSYDSDNTGDWLISEMNSTFFYTYASYAFKYQVWAKNKNNFLKDFFIYSAPLEGSNICKAKSYVDEWETYTELTDDTYLCSNDILSE